MKTLRDPELLFDIELTGWNHGANSIEMVKYIHEVSGKTAGLFFAKGMVENVLAGKSVIVLRSIPEDLVRDTIRDIENYGFKARAV